MERSEEWRSNPIDGARISHCRIDGYVCVDVGLAVRVDRRRRRLLRGLMYVRLADGVEWWSWWRVMLLNVFSRERGWIGWGWELGHVV
jgi:hypothetical protein